MGKLTKFVLKHKVLILLIIFALFLRLPWTYTTIESDEGTFGYTASRILDGAEIYEGDLKGANKTPLIYAFYVIPLSIFGNSIIPVRLFNNIFFLISILFFFKLTKNFFNKKTAIYSTLFYAIFMNIPAFEGYFAMSESFLLPFYIISIYYFQKFVNSKNNHYLLLSSLFAILSILIKQQSIFIYLVLIIGLLIYGKKHKFKEIITLLAVPITFTVFIIIFKFKWISNILIETVLQLFVASNGFSGGYLPFTYNAVILLEGSILCFFAILGLISLYCKQSKKFKFIFGWVTVTVLFVIIPPMYGHYFLFLVPPLSILSGLGLIYLIKSKQNKKISFLVLSCLFLITGFLITEHYPDSQFSYPHLDWRISNFENYQQQISLSEHIKSLTLPEDRILIAGWEPGIYWLSERRVFFRGGVGFDCEYDPEVFVPGRKQNPEVSPKVIVFLPNYLDKCGEFDYFSDIELYYTKSEMFASEIYVKNKV